MKGTVYHSIKQKVIFVMYKISFSWKGTSKFQVFYQKGIQLKQQNKKGTWIAKNGEIEDCVKR